MEMVYDLVMMAIWVVGSIFAGFVVLGVIAACVYGLAWLCNTLSGERKKAASQPGITLREFYDSQRPDRMSDEELYQLASGLPPSMATNAQMDAAEVIDSLVFEVLNHRNSTKS